MGRRPPARSSGAEPPPPGGPGRWWADQTPGGSQHDRAALAAALDPILTINQSGTIQSASDSVHRVLGWRPAELVGQNINILIPEPHHSAHDGYLANYARTGQTNIMNRPRRFDALHRDGRLIPIELCVSRADLSDGGGPLFVGIIRDMTVYVAAERSRDEERIRSQQQLAEQTVALQAVHLRLRMADRMASIGTLAAGLGHDMNNVLLPVRARLNALRSICHTLGMPSPAREHLEEIRNSVAYLQQLADGLHFLAMDPEADGQDAVGETDLALWWGQVGPLLSKAVPKHVLVTASIDEGLPRVGVPAHGLTQAVLNLVVNAGEAIPAPEVRRRVQGRVNVSAEVMAEDRSHPARVRLSVSDNGVGMPPEVQRRAFDMFFTTKPRGLGTGLGLALVRRIADRAGAAIELESTPGVGTTFSLLLPVAAQGGQGLRPRALIELSDGRVGAMVRHFVEAAGFEIVDGRDPGALNLCVTDGADASAARLGEWRRAHPDAGIVVIGKPAQPVASEQLGRAAAVVDDPGDLDRIREAIAIAAQSGGEGDGNG